MEESTSMNNNASMQIQQAVSYIEMSAFARKRSFFITTPLIYDLHLTTAY